MITKIELNKKYNKYDIIRYCDAQHYFSLARRIEANIHELSYFSTDGCSCWPDKWMGHDFTKCCIKHDIEYWVGGTEDERLIADLELAICVTKISGATMARAMFFGTEFGGLPEWHQSYSWGFGRT